MFRMILYTQWKWSRLIVVLGIVAGFAVPVLSVQQAGRAGVTHSQAAELLHTVQVWGVLYPVLAAALAVLVAMTAWAPDHRGRHVYALSLPLPRWRYALLRFAGGASLLAGPVLAVAIGATFAAATATIPPGLQGYPFGLALRFALATLVAYTVFFAVCSATARTAGLILTAIAALVAVQLLATAAGLDWHLLQGVKNTFLDWPGPFGIFTGRWMIIDV